MNTIERLVEIAYSLNELNRINGHLGVYDLGKTIIKFNNVGTHFEMYLTFSIINIAGNYVTLRFDSSKIRKIRIIEISIGGAYVPGDVKTLLEVIQDKNAKKVIIDNLDLW